MGHIHNVRVEVCEQISRRQVQVDATGSAADRHAMKPSHACICDDRPRSDRAEGRDCSALVPGRPPRLRFVRKRQPFDPQVGPELGPVDLAAAGDQNEDVIVGPTADHDGSQELADLDALKTGAFFNAVRGLGLHRSEIQMRLGKGADRRRVDLHGASLARRLSGPGGMASPAGFQAWARGGPHALRP